MRASECCIASSYCLSFFILASRSGSYMKHSTLILMLCVWITSCAHQPNQTYDILIKNAKIIDGSGGNPYMADIAINGDSIAEIGNLGKKLTATLIF